MRRSDLGPYDGMLFVFGTPTSSSFTMSEVPVPLDIGWYDAAGRPVDRLLMQPCPDRSVSDFPAHSSRGPYTYESRRWVASFRAERSAVVRDPRVRR